MRKICVLEDTRQVSCRLAKWEIEDPHSWHLVAAMFGILHSSKLNIYVLINFFEAIYLLETEFFKRRTPFQIRFQKGVVKKSTLVCLKMLKQIKTKVTSTSLNNLNKNCVNMSTYLLKLMFTRIVNKQVILLYNYNYY